MKLNQEKCYLLVPGHKQENVWARIGQTKSGSVTKTTWCRNSLKFKIEKYVSSLCKKAAKKLSVLARLSHFTNDEY